MVQGVGFWCAVLTLSGLAPSVLLPASARAPSSHRPAACRLSPSKMSPANGGVVQGAWWSVEGAVSRVQMPRAFGLAVGAAAFRVRRSVFTCSEVSLPKP